MSRGLDVGFVGGVDPLPSGSVGARRPMTLFRFVAAFLSNTTTTAQPITAPIAGTYRLILVGPGGSGGARSNSNAPGSGGGALCGGGGSGGVAVSKQISLAAGQAINVTLGQGAPVNAGSAGSTLPGAAGSGPTTATLPDGTAMSAGPGQGGAANPSNSLTAVGGIGGTASGGEFNYPGLAGGSVAVSGTSNGGVRDTYTNSVGLVVTSPLGSVGATADSNTRAGGGGNTPSASGLIPATVGTDGVASTSAGVAVQSFTGSIAVGQGGGGAATTTSSANSGAGGRGAAYLILEDQQ